MSESPNTSICLSSSFQQLLLLCADDHQAWRFDPPLVVNEPQAQGLCALLGVAELQ